MKRLIYLSLLAAMGFLSVSCSVWEDREKCLAPVTIHISDFAVSLDNFPETKATALTEYTSLKCLTLAFYSGSTEVYKATQMKGDESTYTTFGEFSLSLPMDSYTMVVIGRAHYEGDELTLSSPTSATYTSDHVRETFVTTQTVDVTSTSALDLSATLSRIVSKLMVTSTDLRTANAANIQVTVSAGGKSFNPTTGLATENTGFVNTVLGAGETGETATATTYLFLATDDQTIDVTIDVLDSEGDSISHKFITDVPLKRNRITTLSGSLFTAGGSTSFQLNTEWLEGNSVNF